MTSEQDKAQDKAGQNQQNERHELPQQMFTGLEVNRSGETMVLSRWSYERDFRALLRPRLSRYMNAKLHSYSWPSKDFS